MHRHRELCERAVDPLEIAAGLEAPGHHRPDGGPLPAPRCLLTRRRSCTRASRRPETGRRVSGPATEQAGGQRGLGGSCASSGARDADGGEGHGGAAAVAPAGAGGVPAAARPAVRRHLCVPHLAHEAAAFRAAASIGTGRRRRGGGRRSGAAHRDSPAARRWSRRVPRLGAARPGPGAGSAPASVRPAPGAAADASSAGATGSARGVRRGLLRPKPRAAVPLQAAGLWACWLLAYALYGDWSAGRTARRRARLPPRPCPACPRRGRRAASRWPSRPPAWCARRFAVRARRRLDGQPQPGGVRRRSTAAARRRARAVHRSFLALQWAAHAVAAESSRHPVRRNDPGGVRGPATDGAPRRHVLGSAALHRPAAGRARLPYGGRVGPRRRACVIEALALAHRSAAPAARPRRSGPAALSAAVALPGHPAWCSRRPRGGRGASACWAHAARAPDREPPRTTGRGSRMRRGPAPRRTVPARRLRYTSRATRQGARTA